jgi:hypothetical protein
MRLASHSNSAFLNAPLFDVAVNNIGELLMLTGGCDLQTEE